jgi:alpha-beta hydrolase superfamily lysophospholipase
MFHLEDEWKTQDEIKLYWQEWQPDADYLCGVVLLVHGLGEHSGRYGHVAEAFTQSGYVLMAFDQRGHGRSEGTRGDEIIDTTCQDIDHFLQEAKQRYPQLPVFLYGHSLGGLLVLYYSITHRPDVAGVISTAPALAAEKGVSPSTILMAKVMSRLIPKMQINNGLDRSGLSRIPDVIEKYNNDPLVHGKITARFGLELMEKGKWVRDHTEFPLPLLLINGSADRIIDPEAVKQFGSTLKGDITVSILDGFYHEVHNEPGQKEVLQQMLQWMDKANAASVV